MGGVLLRQFAVTKEMSVNPAHPKTILFLIVLFFLTGCSEKPTLPYLEEDAVILAFGDSLTAGYGVSLDDSYPSILQKLTGRKVINAGINGETTAEGLKRIDKILEKTNPALVILMEGGNDILRTMNMQQAKANLIQMIDKIEQLGIPVILLGIPEKSIFLSTHPIYEKIAKEKNIVFLEDIMSELIGDNAMKSDRIHLNADGYKKLAQTIFKTLKDTGAIK